MATRFSIGAIILGLVATAGVIGIAVLVFNNRRTGQENVQELRNDNQQLRNQIQQEEQRQFPIITNQANPTINGPTVLVYTAQTNITISLGDNAKPGDVIFIITQNQVRINISTQGTNIFPFNAQNSQVGQAFIIYYIGDDMNLYSTFPISV